MDSLLITAILFGAMIVLMALGTPVAFALGGLAVLFAFFLWNPAALYGFPLTIMGSLNVFVLISLPLFVFMGVFLQHSQIAEDLFGMFQKWVGALPGGLAVATVGVCTVFAGMVGTSSAATLAVGSAALPAMLSRGYQKEISLGCIQAGGALGFLIPPSVMFIIYGVFAQASVGRLFAGGLFPGLLLSFLFMVYILIRCFFQPRLGPPFHIERRDAWKIRFASLKRVILPIILVAVVVGAMLSGIATPTEAAAAGALGSIVCAAIYHSLTWERFKKACYDTLIFTGMGMWIMIGAKCFVSVYMAVGAGDFVKQLFLGLGLERFGTLAVMMLIVFILGCLLDPFGIIMICTPVFLPVVGALGIDPIWFGVLFVVNLEMAYLTPPFGFNLFYMKGLCAVIAKDITMGDIYRSIGPFVALQMLGLVICMIFPEISLWLPNLVFGAAK